MTYQEAKLATSPADETALKKSRSGDVRSHFSLDDDNRTIINDTAVIEM